MNGSTSETTTPVPMISVCAWAASSLARCARRSASSANWVGFIFASPGSGSLCGKELRVHDGAAAGQQHTFHDLVAFRQLRRIRLLVPESGQEGEQIARVERRGGDRDAAGPVEVAQDGHAIRGGDALAGHGGGAVAAGIGSKID